MEQVRFEGRPQRSDSNVLLIFITNNLLLVALLLAPLLIPVFFYGQTGAGKSWSCFGDILTTSDISTSTSNDGVITRALRDLYSPPSTPSVHRSVTFFEIFNERVHDLLSPPPALHKSQPALPVRTHPTKGSYIEGITEVQASTLSSCLKLVRKGYARRAVAGTKMNDQSSRSHAVVRVMTVTHDEEVRRQAQEEREGQEGCSETTSY